MGPKIAAHYEIIEKVGEGGYSAVYKARDLHVPRFVALKFVSRDLLSSEQAIRRFRHEARAVSTLSHPNIVVLHDFDTDPETGRLFLVLEYLPGGTLRDVIRSGEGTLPLRPFELLRCATAIAAGLSHAHRHGVIHRDVKASNVMFSEERVVKVTDFGLAKSIQAPEQTEAGATPGTIPYMSPEQARGLAVDHRTDIFSLGVLLYEMATGELPFGGTTPYEILGKIISEPTPRVRGSGRDMPEGLDRIIQRATAKDPGKRYQEMEQLETDLLALNHSLESLARKSTSVVRQERPTRRRAIGAVAIVAALAAGVLGFLRLVGGVSTFEARPKNARLLAVVPFHCLGTTESHKAFCEGLANTLSTKFTQIEGLQDRVLVVPYSDVRGQQVSSAADANRVFKVQLALTGSVEFIGETVRVIVNLVDAQKMVQTASRKVDSTAGSLVRLQDETSDLAGNMLQVRLAAADRRRVNAGQTPNATAFDLFTRGLGRFSRSEAIEETREASRLFEEAVRADPDYALAHAYLGETHLREYKKTGDGAWIDRARASCERALAIDSRLVQAHLAMAKVWQARTDPEQAIRELRIALQFEPRNADALRELGNAYAELGIRKRDAARKQEAIDTFQEAIALRPELWTTHRDLGLAHVRMGDLAKAESEFRRMVDLTSSPDAYRQLGALYYLMGRTEEAIECQRKSLAIRPTPEAYSNIATIYFYLKRYTDVIPNYEAAIRLHERAGTADHVIWGNLASAYIRSPGTEAKARAAWREAIRLGEAKLQMSPKDADTHASVAFYRMKVGDRPAAIRHAQEAIALAPEVASVLFRCGVVYEISGDREQALELINRAIERGHPMTEVLNAGDLAALRRESRFQKHSTK